MVNQDSDFQLKKY